MKHSSFRNKLGFLFLVVVLALSIGMAAIASGEGNGSVSPGGGGNTDISPGGGGGGTNVTPIPVQQVFKIYVTSSGSGTVEVYTKSGNSDWRNRQKAGEGDIVKIVVKPDSNWVLEELTVKKTVRQNGKKRLVDIDDVENKDGEYFFTMPRTSVTVEATFGGIRQVSVMPPSYGSVTVSKTSALRGDTINLTATPVNGYTLDTLRVWRGQDLVEVTEVGVPSVSNWWGEEASFTMPDGDVTVEAVFRELVSVRVYGEDELETALKTADYIVLYEYIRSSENYLEVPKNRKVVLDFNQGTVLNAFDNLEKYPINVMGKLQIVGFGNFIGNKSGNGIVVSGENACFILNGVVTIYGG